MRAWMTLALLAVLSWAAGAVTMAATKSANVADVAMRGSVEDVRALLEAGSDANQARGDGMTALHWAADRGDAEMAKVLIDAGAELEVTTRLGAHTPLHVASRKGRAGVVEVLLEAGSAANARTTTGATPLHFAAGSGSAESVILLLEHGAKPNVPEPKWGQTPLMFAAAAGRTEAVHALLERGADPSIAGRVIDIAARDEEDARERKARNRRVAELRRKEMGLDETAPKAEANEAEAKEEKEEAKDPAPAAETEIVDRDEELRRGGEPVPLDYADLVATYGGLTPLLLAAREGYRDTAVALIQGGADINQTSAADHTSPMLMAMINGHFDLAIQFLSMGADPTVASNAGATPLYAALNMQWAPKARHPQPVDYRKQQHTYLEVMEKLLESGVDPNARLEKTLWFTTYNRDLLGVNRAGATAFWRAAHALDIDAMKLLLRYGADPDMATIHVPERRFGEKEVDEDQSGLPPVPFGGPAVYPIHAASGVGHGQGFAGNSHRHVPDGWVPAVKFLVEELGADVNARDHNGFTPAHHAAARGDNELIEYLVSKGADVTLVSRSGQTTVDMANGPVQRVQPFPETIALLESLGAKNNHNCVSC